LDPNSSAAGPEIEIVRGRARRYYRLTDAGAATLRAGAGRMAEAAELVVSRMMRMRPEPAA